MSATQKVMQLEPVLRDELDARLRSAAYGDLVAISTWVTDRAPFPISKSSLHRYAMGLKASDAARGHGDALKLIAITNANRTTSVQPNGHRAVLLMRLGQIEVERQRILEQLLPMMVGET